MRRNLTDAFPYKDNIEDYVDGSQGSFALNSTLHKAINNTYVLHLEQN